VGSQDLLTSMLKPTLEGGDWDLDLKPLKKEPLDITLWAESKCKGNQVLCLDFAGDGANWKSPGTITTSEQTPIKTPTIITTTSTLEQEPSDGKRPQQPIFCEFCNNWVTTHVPTKCYKNPKNKKIKLRKMSPECCLGQLEILARNNRLNKSIVNLIPLPSHR